MCVRASSCVSMCVLYPIAVKRQPHSPPILIKTPRYAYLNDWQEHDVEAPQINVAINVQFLLLLEVVEGQIEVDRNLIDPMPRTFNALVLFGIATKDTVGPPIRNQEQLNAAVFCTVIYPELKWQPHVVRVIHPF